MSVGPISAVFNYSTSKGSARLVLLAMADEASDDGLLTAYRRSQSHFARKANVGRASVPRAIQSLVEMGEVEILKKGDGRASTDYRIILPGIGEGAQGDTPQNADRAPRVPKVSTQGTQGDTPIIPFSPVTPPTDSPKPRKSPFPAEFLLTEAMKEWADAEVPGVDLRKQTKMFADHFRGNGERKVDWVAAWRNWMRRSEEFSRPKNGHRPASSGQSVFQVVGSDGFLIE